MSCSGCSPASGVARSSAERRAQQLIAVSFFLLAGYVGVEALRTLVNADHPAASWVGIGLAAFTAPTMPLLAYAKRRLGNQLHSSATVKEAAQTQLCAYLSIALLLGLGANALAGWWWADPLAALVDRRGRAQGRARELARRRLLRRLLIERRTRSYGARRSSRSRTSCCTDTRDVAAASCCDTPSGTRVPRQPLDDVQALRPVVEGVGDDEPRSCSSS